MARPRKFDEAGAVDAAMRTFWSAGYEGTSTQDLCTATGLGRSSIYNTFRSKHDLFIRALRRYMDSKNADTFELLDGPGSAREKIEKLLWRTVDAPAGEPLGCLVVNSTVDMGPRDDEVATMLRLDRDRRTSALVAVLRAGQSAGEIDDGVDPADLARFVVATISGMRVAARGGADREELAGIAGVALRSL